MKKVGWNCDIRMYRETLALSVYGMEIDQIGTYGRCQSLPIINLILCLR